MRRILLVTALLLALPLVYLGTIPHVGDVTTDLASRTPHFGFVTPLEAQAGDFRGFQKTFTTQTTTGATASSGLMRGIAVWHTAELIVTGGPATCTYSLQGTKDAVTWFTISASAITCTTTTVAFESGKPAVQVRGNLLTLTGGTSPTVTLKYVGR